MRKFKNSLLFALFMTFVNSIAFADAVYPQIDMRSPKSVIFFGIYLLIMLFFVALLYVISSAKKNGNEEKYNKVVRGIEESVFWVSVVLGLFFFATFIMVYSYVGIIEMLVYLYTVIVSVRIRYTYKDIKGSNLVFYIVSFLVYLCSSFGATILMF